MSTASHRTWPEKRLRFLTQRELSREQLRSLAGATQASFLPMESIGEQGSLDFSAVRDVDDVQNSYTRFFDGDVLVAKITPCFENGKGGVVRGTLNGVGFGTTELHVLSPSSEIDARYLYYVTVSDRFRRFGEAAMYGAAGQKRVPERYIMDYRVPVPALAQQHTVADYLDRETARLNELMVVKERLLRLLEEKRQATITDAVTGGIDSGAALRDPGNAPFGKIPEGWLMKPLRAVADCLTSNVDKHSVEGERPVRLCNYTNVYNNEYVHPRMDLMRATASEGEISRFGLRVNDVVITKDSETWEDIGVPALVTETAEDFVCGYHLALLRPNADAIEGRFLLRLLQARPVQVQFELAARGMTRFGLLISDIMKTLLPVPPLPMQSIIADYLDRETARLETLREAAARTIGLLNERRAALISAAVTGEIDVGSKDSVSR